MPLAATRDATDHRAAPPDVLGAAARSLCLCLLLGGCSSDDPPPFLYADGHIPLADAALHDEAPTPDLLPWFGDGRPDVACKLGTPDDCASCGDSCPPGQDDALTARVCTQGNCSIQCKEEGYDVDGAAGTGCEVEDDLPIHDDQASARDLGKHSDCSDDISATGTLPSDDRLHQKAPSERPNGRPDWFRISIDDTFGCVVNADVRLSTVALPPATHVAVTAFYVCDNGKTLQAKSKSTTGGGEVVLTPDVSCTTIGDDSGTLYISIKKTGGTHTAASYTVTVLP